MTLDNEQSVYREKVIEHLLVSRLLVFDWNSGIAALDVLKPEIDRFGYDIVLKRRDVTRYVQIKSSSQTSPVARQKVHRHLLEMVNGAIVWVVVDERLTMVSFRAIIPAVGTSIGLGSFKVAKHTKANAKGEKAERPHIRTIPKAAFQKVENLEALFGLLFPDAATAPGMHAASVEQG